MDKPEVEVSANSVGIPDKGFKTQDPDLIHLWCRRSSSVS